MRVHLINPSDVSFGTAVITPRWLYVLAGATPRHLGDPVIVDETLDPIDLRSIGSGDIVGIGIHTSNALRGYTIGRAAREQGAWVVFGGIHATLYPDEAFEHGAAHAVVTGDGDQVWPHVIDDCLAGHPERLYDGRPVRGESFVPARWDLLPPDRYMWGSVQTVRGCPKHCSFCSVWRTDGQAARQRTANAVVREVVELRRLGFRFIALADDNFYPVTLGDLRAAERRKDPSRLEALRAQREEQFDLMRKLAALPRDIHFFTQITMEAAEDPEFLKAMKAARILGALVGVESVTPEGLKAIYKEFNGSAQDMIDQLQAFRQHGVHVLGSFIFGLPTDRPETFAATADFAERAGITFAQFVMLTPFPGTIDFAKWEKEAEPQSVAGVPVTRHWLIPASLRPKIYTKHPVMSPDDLRQHTQVAWDRFYRWSAIWKRSRCVRSLRGRLAFFLVSKLYRQMYANTGITADSARYSRSTRWARRLAKPTRRLFVGQPMPDLPMPV